MQHVPPSRPGALCAPQEGASAPPLTRRQWLATGLAGLAGGASVWASGWAQSVEGGAVQDEEPTGLYLACRQRAGGHEAAAIDGLGREHLSLPLPQRGHSFAIDRPRRRAVVFGRQPGFFAQAFDLPERFGSTVPPGDAVATITPAQERHFFGHGVFSPDGHCLLATENDYHDGRAVIGVYDASPGGRYRRITEWHSGGIGAHEAVLLQDGRTLCVANGGLLTHPDYDKTPLNLADMQPSLAYLDLRSGAVLEQVQLPRQWHQLSIRHLIVAGDGAVWFGCQHMGPATEQPPLVGRHRRGRQPELFAGQPATLARLKNYIGSLAVDASGSVIATSSPVGGLTVFWDAGSGRELGWRAMPDGCGIAGMPGDDGQFLRSSGLGRLERTQGVGAGASTVPLVAQQAGIAWDNHLRAVG